MAGPLGRLRDRMVQPGSTRLFDRCALAPVNLLRSGRGLEPLGSVWDQFGHARMHLVLSSQAFDFPGQLPGNARFVGPVLDDPAWASDAGWTDPGGEGPLVLVAMPSTFQDHAQCLQRIIDALGTLPVRGVVTTGPPLVVLHHGRDQADNAVRVSARGAGKAVPRTDSPKRIAAAGRQKRPVAAAPTGLRWDHG